MPNDLFLTRQWWFYGVIFLWGVVKFSIDGYDAMFRKECFLMCARVVEGST